MLRIRIILLTLMTLNFSSMAMNSSNAALPDPIYIKTLTEKILNFEKACYDSNKISASVFLQGINYIDQLIELYASLALQFPDSNFVNQAIIYLEKQKNLKILGLLCDSSLVTGANVDNEQLSILNCMKSSNKISTMGKNLCDVMKQPVNISDLQKNFLDDYEAVLNFWIKENKIFVFILTKDSLKIEHWDIPIDHVKVQIDRLISPFLGNIDLFKLDFDYHAAFELYQYLFLPLERHIQPYRAIYIIPDNFLIGFPFELLVTDTPGNFNPDNEIYYHRFSQLNYLIKKYAICYNYSMSVFELTKGLDRTTKKLGRRLLTMSEPIIPPGTNQLLKQNHNFTSSELEISDYSSDEIKRVSRLLFRHDNLKKDQVTKLFLFEQGRTYRWLYFALPGVLDNNQPLNSGLLFTGQRKDSSELTSWLSIAEAMQTTLSADLLTLSASQVSSFELEGNPGVMGLPQAFLFSGVKSVLFSVWRINSISTSQFMSKFYWELKYKRQTNVLALREAKIASMRDTFIHKDKKVSRAHPYFWATFQLIGNPKIRPPSPTKLPIWGVIIIVYICVILGTVYITRKTMPDRKR